MTNYVVVKRGVYLHSVLAVFNTLEEAKTHADLAASAERDSYHTFGVIPFEVGHRSLDEPREVYATTKPRVVIVPKELTPAEVAEVSGLIDEVTAEMEEAC